MDMFGAVQRVRGPRWVILILGIACVLVGATLLTRPFQSLTVLIILIAAGSILNGLSDLADRSDAPSPSAATIAGVGWIVLGIAVLIWPGLSLRTLAIVVGVALIVSGIMRAISAFRAGADQRATARLLGAASIILGIVALAWPDITLLVVAVVFGVRMVIFGLARLGDAIRRPKPDIDAEAPDPPSRLARYAKTVGAALALLLSLALLRTEPMSRAISAGAQAWRLLYTTTRADGVPALASALVVAPKNLPAGPRPVIAWAHGTMGVDETCAPSLLKDPFAAGASKRTCPPGRSPPRC